MTLNITEFLGKQALLEEPNWVSDVSQEFHHRYDIIRFLSKGYRHSDQQTTDVRFRMRWLLKDREEIWQMLSLFSSMFGRLGTFWVPSWTRDVVVVEAFASDAIQLEIEAPFPFNLSWGAEDYFGKYLFITMKDGTEVIREIIGTPVSNIITLDEALGLAHTEDDLPFLVISFLYLCRFDQDEIELEYHTSSVAETDLTIKAVMEEIAFLGMTTTTTTVTVSTTTVTAPP